MNEWSRGRDWFQRKYPTYIRQKNYIKNNPNIRKSNHYYYNIGLQVWFIYWQRYIVGRDPVSDCFVKQCGYVGDRLHNFNEALVNDTWQDMLVCMRQDQLMSLINLNFSTLLLELSQSLGHMNYWVHWCLIDTANGTSDSYWRTIG